MLLFQPKRLEVPRGQSPIELEYRRIGPDCGIREEDMLY